MTTPDPDEMDEKLEEVEQDIEAARRQAEEHGTIPDTTPEPTYRDPDADDSTDA